MLYFAYGSNLNQQQMRQRCPGSRFLKPYFLEHYQLSFQGTNAIWNGAVANIIPSSGNIVWGGVYEITANDLASLDYFEEYPHKYTRELISLSDENKNIMQAIAYMMRNQEENLPSQRYKDAIIQGAIHSGLPEEYLLFLKKIQTTNPHTSFNKK